MNQQSNRAANVLLRKIVLWFIGICVLVFCVTSFLVSLRDAPEKRRLAERRAIIDSIIAESPLSTEDKLRIYRNAETNSRQPPVEVGSLLVTGEGYVACTNKAMIEKVKEYWLSGDERGFQQFRKENYPAIFTLRAGLPVYIIEEDVWNGFVKIRAKGETTEMWTSRDAVR